jgi:hypothetical protein
MGMQGKGLLGEEAKIGHATTAPLPAQLFQEDGLHLSSEFE